MLQEKGSRRVLRMALATLGVLILVIGCTAAYYLLDTNRLKGPLARLVSAQTGRDLTIRGDLILDLGRRVDLRINEAELANAEWAADPAMLKLDRISISVDALSLLDGPLLIEELRIEGAHVSLEKAADGTGNWQLIEDGGGEGSGYVFDEGLPVVLRRLNIDGCLLTYVTPERSSPLHLEIVSLDQGADADGFLDLSGEGVLEDRPIRIEGKIGPFAALLNARNFRHQLAITIGETQIRSRGSVGDLTELEDIEVVVDVHEPDAGFYANLLGVPGALAGPIELEAALSPNRPGIGAEAAGNVGSFEVVLSGHIEKPLDLDGLKLQAHLAGPDLAVVGEILEIPGLPAGPFDIAGELSRSGGAVIVREAKLSAGDVELTIDAEFAKLPDPDGGTVMVNLRGSDLGRIDRLLGPLPGLRHKPFEASVALTQEGEGDEKIEATVVVGQNRLAMDGILGSYPEFVGSRFDVDLRGPDVAELGDFLGLNAAVTGPYRASGGLVWSGAVLEIEKLAISAGPMDVRGSGSLKNFSSFRGSSLLLNTAGPDLFALGKWMGTDALPHLPYSVSGRLRAGEEQLVLEEIRGGIGDVKVEASARIGDLTRRADVELDLKMEGPGLDPLIAEPLGFEFDDTPFEFSGKLRRRETSIEVSGLRYRSSNASLSVDGNLGTPPSLVGMKLAFAAQGPSLRDVLPKISDYTPSNRPYRFSGEIGRPGDQTLVFDQLSVELGGVAATAGGVWDFPREPEAVRLLLNASGSDLNDLGEWGELVLPALPFTLEAEIDAARGSVALQAFSGSWGESDLRGHAKIDYRDKPRIVAAVGSDRIDLSPFLRGEGVGDDGVDEPPASDGRVIPDAALPLEKLRSADVSLGVDIAELVLGRETLEHLKLDLTVQDGALRIEPFEFIHSDGTVLLNLALIPAERRPELDLSLRTRNARFGFFRAEGQAAETLPPYDIDMSLQGSGANTRDIAADLSGSMRIESTGGVILNSRVGAWFDDFLVQLFDAILPTFEDEPKTRLDCAVFDASFEAGTLRASPGLVARTDKLNLFARGRVDLASEALDVNFRTEARRGIGVSVVKILTPFVRVGGTLGQPEMRFDATGAVISGTAAVATFGWSIAARALWDRIRGTRNPCVRMLEPEK